MVKNIRAKSVSLLFGIAVLFLFLSQIAATSFAAPPCNFSVYANGSGPYSLNGFKFWAGLPSTYYEVSISVSDAPGNYAVYLVKPTGDTILFLGNQSSSTIKEYFAADSSLYSGGGYKFRVTPQGVPGTTWCESDSFYQGTLPNLTVTTSPTPMVIGEQATVDWTVSGGLAGLANGGWTGDIRLQWYQNSTPLNNLDQIPVSDGSYSFTVPDSIAGGTVPGVNFRIAGANADTGTSIPGGMVSDFSGYFDINSPPKPNIGINQSLVIAPTRTNPSTIYSLPELSEYGGIAPFESEKNLKASFQIVNNGDSSVTIEDWGVLVTGGVSTDFRITSGSGFNLSSGGVSGLFDKRGYITEDQLSSGGTTTFTGQVQVKIDGTWIDATGSGSSTTFTVYPRPSLTNGMLIKKPRNESSSDPNDAKIYFHQNDIKWDGISTAYDGLFPDWETEYYVYPGATIAGLAASSTPNTNSIIPIITGRNLLYKLEGNADVYIIEPEPGYSSLISRKFENEEAFYSYGYSDTILNNEPVELGLSQISWMQSQYPVGTTITSGETIFGHPAYTYQVSCCGYNVLTCANSTRYHTGIDYSGNGSKDIIASNDGQVINVEYMSANDHGMGNNIIVEHILSNGSKVYSTYSHLESVETTIEEGINVYKGQKIGEMGGSGYGQLDYWPVHLHFEIKDAPVTNNPSGDGIYWGYIPSNPDNYGYHDPNDFIGKIACISICPDTPQDRSLVRVEGQGTIYWLQNEKKYHVLNQDVINAMFRLSGWNNICDYSASILDSYPDGPNFIDTGVGSNGLLVQESGDSKVYLIENGEKRWIASETDFNEQGYDWNDIITISNDIFVNNAFTNGLSLFSDNNLTLEELNEHFSYDWDFIDRESIFSIVSNCNNDPEYTYMICEYREKEILWETIPYCVPKRVITNSTNEWIRTYSSTTDNPIGPLVTYTEHDPVVEQMITPWFDNSWGNDISSDDSFNTVFKGIPAPTGNFEVISHIDKYGPFDGTTNDKCYFFTYDTKNDNNGDAVTLSEWIDYLKTVTVSYGRQIDTLTIFAHGSTASVNMSDNFKLEDNLATRLGIERLKNENILATDATILLFSCNVGKGSTGEAFIQNLADWSGATVYASSNLTGPYVKKGNLITRDWNLDIVKLPTDPGTSQEPLAVAESPDSVLINTSVSLDGTKSIDADDGIASYFWEQLNGTTVSLSDVNSIQPVFTAPAVSQDEILIFQLTVTDYSGQQSTDTSAITITTGNTLPSPPTGLSVCYQSSIEWNYLTWNHVSNAASYKVYWGTGPGVTVESNVMPETVTTDYGHTGVASGSCYYYRISAVNSAGRESGLSSEVFVCLPAALPDTLTGINAIYQESSGRNYITWNQANNATGYKVYWGTSPGVTTNSNVMPETATIDYGHTGVENGSCYYYRVSAINSVGESGLSAEASVCLPAAPPDIPYVIIENNIQPGSSSEFDINGSKEINCRLTISNTGDAAALVNIGLDMAGDDLEMITLPEGFTYDSNNHSFNQIVVSAGGSVNIDYTARYVGSNTTHGHQVVNTARIMWIDNYYDESANVDLGGHGALLSQIVVAVSNPSIPIHIDEWEWQNPLPQGNSLNDIWGSSEDNTFAVGNNGTILHYDGNSWMAMSSGTDNDLKGIYGVSRTHVIAVGDSGTILRYDGNTCWIEMSSGTSANLDAVWGDSKADVFTVGEGGVILHYDGNSWIEMSSGISNNLYGVWGSSGNAVFAVGQGGIILYYDGSTWTEMASGTTECLKGVWGSSGSNVFAVGYNGAILHYDGSSWTVMASGTTAHFRDVWGSSGSDVFAVGYSGSYPNYYATILHYDGSSWTTMSSETTECFCGVWSNSRSDVFAVGENGAILHYDGSSWTAMSSGTTGSLEGVWSNSGSDVFAAGGGGSYPNYYATILHYDGSSWTEMENGTTEYLKGIWGSSGSDVFAVGTSGAILHYDGSSWVEMLSGTTNNLYGVWGNSGDDVFAVGQGGVILHYDGNSWREMTNGSSHDLYGVWGSSGNDVFAVGAGNGSYPFYNNVIYHYDGNRWIKMTCDFGNLLTDVWGSSESDVFAVGWDGTILHYDGNSWLEMLSGTTNKLYGVWGSSGNDVFAVGRGGVILHYDGNSWRIITKAFGKTLNDIWGNSENDAFTVGYSGTILHQGKKVNEPYVIISHSIQPGESSHIDINGNKQVKYRISVANTGNADTLLNIGLDMASGDIEMLTTPTGVIYDPNYHTFNQINLSAGDSIIIDYTARYVSSNATNNHKVINIARMTWIDNFYDESTLVDLGGHGKLASQAIAVINPQNAFILGSVDTPCFARDVDISGSYVYTTDAWEGLHVINIDDPQHPEIVSSVNLSGSADSICISEHYACIGTGGAGGGFVNMVDITNPVNPIIVGSVNVLNDPWGIDVSGSYAYVAAAERGFLIIDIVDPQNPTIVGAVDIVGTADDVFIHFPHAYIVGSDSLQIINVADPQNPTIIGSVNLPNWNGGIYVSDDYAYVAASEEGLQVIDISNPHVPTIVGSLNMITSAMDVYVSGLYAYVTDYNEGLHIVDISNPVNPTIVDSVNTPDHANGIDVVDQYAYVADGNSGLQIIDISMYSKLSMIPYVTIIHTTQPEESGEIDINGNKQLKCRLTISNTGDAAALLNVGLDMAGGDLEMVTSSINFRENKSFNEISVAAGSSVNIDYTARYVGGNTMHGHQVVNTARIMWIKNYYDEDASVDLGGHGPLTAEVVATVNNPSSEVTTSEWVWQNPLPQGNSLSAIWGSSGSDVFAVGANGTIIHYDGNTWTSMPSGMTEWLNGVWGSSENDVFAVGRGSSYPNCYGLILHYDGITWNCMSLGETESLYGIWGSSGNDVFAVGSNGTILHYDGSVWNSMSSTTTKDIRGIWGNSGNDVFAVGEGGTILHYDGSVWTAITSGTTNYLFDIWGSSGNDVFVVGNGIVLHYNGSAWTEMSRGTAEILYGVCGTSGNDVYAADGWGKIHHYDGSSWSEVPGLATDDLYDVWDSSGSDVFAVGDGGTILHYDRNTWTVMSLGATKPLYAICGSSGNDIFTVGGNGTILHYNGSTWTEMASGTTNTLEDIWSSSESDFFAVGYTGTILHYDGSAWTAMSSGTTCPLFSVWGSSGSDVFAVGHGGSYPNYHGVIFHYDGSAWTEMSIGTSDSLYGIWGDSGNNVFAVGASGTVLHYDGGTWTTMSSGTTEYLMDIWGSSGNNVYAVDSNGNIYHYDGSSWSGVSGPQAYDFDAVWGSAGNDIFVVGYSGKILHYDGSTWTSMAIGTSNRLYGIWGSSGSDVFAVGENGTILHYGKSLPDTDEDGLSDDFENTTCTDPNDADTDDDGITDGVEDANHNGIVDTGETDPCKIDTDGDAIQDGTESGYTLTDIGEDTSTELFQTDLDPSTTTDPLDVDTDNDGIPDGLEDTNRNGAVDIDETDPCDIDTDHDGMPDGWEVNHGLNPRTNDAGYDLDGDTFSNILEYQAGSDPADPDSQPQYAQKGDINGDGEVNLVDAILSLQVVSNMELSSKVCNESDINGDGRIGIQEAIYILQVVSGIKDQADPQIDVVRSTLSRDPLPDVEQTELSELITGNNAFALELYQAICEQNDNLFYSPYSISLALAMTYAGARNETEQQMADTLHFSLGQECLHPAFNALDHELASRGEGAEGQDGKGFRLNIANSIWGQQGYSFLPRFLDVVAENYGAGLRLLDFCSAPDDCRIVINDWVSDQTEGKIEDLIPQGAISPLTRLVLTNAIYFNAAWSLPFDEDLTQDDTFYLLDSGQVSAPMMSQTGHFGYTEGENYQAVELLYDGEELSMVILLPSAGRFVEFESSIAPDLLNGILYNLELKNVQLKLPRFTYESSSVSLKDTLAQMGMPIAFTGFADFSGMDETRNLFISDIIHKAFILVDEAGTEAAAATAVIVGEVSIPPPPLEVTINRPFVFLIRDIKTGVILFAGRVLNPTS